LVLLTRSASRGWERSMRSHRHRHTMKRTDGLHGRSTAWAGPYQIGSYLENAVRFAHLRPPEAPGVYVISERGWGDLPDRSCGLLYVSRAAYVRLRIGQLLCDMCGFTSDGPKDEAYQHRGGHQLWHSYCTARQVEPLSLYIGWSCGCACLDCAELKLAEMLTIRLNVLTVRSCASHRPPLDLAENCQNKTGTFFLRRQ